MKRSWLNESQSKNLMRAVLLGALAVGSVMAACSSEDPPGIGDGTKVEGDAGVPPCTEGSTKSCYATIGLHNGVLTCYEGTQTCAEGVWTECADGEVTSKAWTGALGTGTLNSPLAVTATTDCEDNPCDPTCQNMDGDPDVISEPDVVQNYLVEYVGGSVDGLPHGLVYGKGIIEPCMSGADCQFNHECTDVATATACGHSKCTEGSAFLGTCAAADPCVNAVCANQPSCCGTPCAHDPCTIGNKLEKTCDTCVSSICDVMPACCTGTWNAACVAAIATVGNACAAKKCVCAAGDTYQTDGHCYRYISNTSKFAAATSTCRAIGGGVGWDLATITSGPENTLVGGMIPNGTEAWIGLEYYSSAWHWTNAETFNGSSYTDWKTSDPKKNCAVKTNAATKSWDEDGCTSTNNPFVCEGPGTVLSPASSAAIWDSTCVSKVATVCDATCGTTGTGTCEPREQGDIDTTCAGIDLAVAVPCDDAIPVCNHGTQTAPAGIPIIHYPGNSTHYGKCNPPNTQQDKGVTCATTEAIPPGECIWVTTCGLGDHGIGSNRQIYVNPSGLAGYQSNECSCLDNWSESHRGVPCLDPVCSTASAEATLKTVNLYLVVDKSGSMGFAGNGGTNTCSVSGGVCSCNSNSRWTGAKNALKSFFQSSSVDNINVSLEMYPLNAQASVHDGCGLMDGNGYATDCNSTLCAHPYAPLGPLSSATQEFDLIAALDGTCPFGGTPTYAALKGSLEAAVAGRTANSADVHAVVLVSDGEPTSCNPSAPYVYGSTTNGDRTAMINLATNAYNQFTDNPVRTYTIGIGDSNFNAGDVAYNLLNSIAAGGGGGGIIKVDSSSSSAVETQLLNALTGIATNGVDCEFALPDVSVYDPTSVTTLYLPGDKNGNNQNDAVKYDRICTGVGAACDCVNCDMCYDQSPAPTTLSLCSNICESISDDPQAQVSVLLGCPTNFEPAEGTQVYEGTCPPGTRVQWGYFSYVSTTPSDSYVQFSFRTAETEAALAGNFTLGATAQANPDTQVCPMSGGPTGCPVDLYQVLDIPAAMMPILEVKASAYPATGGHEFPTISDWQITYSCPPSE